ncbi:Long-chain fatty acid transport protein 1, partial [Orchesella cincta]
HCLLNAGKEPTVVFQGQEPNFTDPVLYLFTSGTTGVPKAVLISHGRLYFITSIASAVKLSMKDVSYSAVPMYHVVGLFGPVWSLCYGTPSVLVVNQPELERSHTLRAMIGGGGLRADVWSGFKTRFGIKSFWILNLEEKVEACGYIPIWLQPIHPIQLVKTNEFTGEILRDNATGFAIQCDDDEPGELIGKIVNGIPMMRFEGYTEKEATEKKIARNVFKKGDKYFLSGDCLTRDKYGYFYFQDRLGDTFRWKGENVATTMVEGVISKLTGMQNNVVYGVKIPAEGLKQSLPKYAMPMFIRIVNDERGLDMRGPSKSKNEG